MPYSPELQARIDKLIEAFESDGFKVDNDGGVLIQNPETESGLGIRVQHKTIMNYENKPKFAYYLEGTPRQRGYLVGCLAPDSVETMVDDFVNMLPYSLIGLKVTPGGRIQRIASKILRVIFCCIIKRIKKYVPDELREEMEGIYEGYLESCQNANKEPEFTLQGLWILNGGIDVLLSRVLAGPFLFRRSVKPVDVRIPSMCNGFALFGDLTENGKHFLGRDWMFPEAGVLQDHVCMMIINPVTNNGSGSYPLISVCTPGMVGTIAGLNSKGVGIGMNLLYSKACSTYRPGLNNLLLARHVLEKAENINDAVDLIAGAQRGVSSLYLLGDGSSDKACVLEAIRSLNFSSTKRLAKFFCRRRFISRQYRPYLPNWRFLRQHIEEMGDDERELLKKGIGIRWNDYRYPDQFLEFNEGLWEYYNGKLTALKKIEILDEAFHGRGFINRHYTEYNCPSVRYFPPLREDDDNLVLVTNHAVIPEIRMTGMSSWIAAIAGDDADENQWRYDALNNLLLQEIAEGPIDEDKAVELIDYLAPEPNNRPYKCHYDTAQRSTDFEKIAIGGSVSLMELKGKTIKSHFGYYCDDWVRLELLKYI